ncbi:hypothetical protein [Chamaesiphon sp. VAR_48_metabat_403]|uniref:hypothetical protein n=1 Tax=Chamaesiphon sp. VAR_48_metabat_403 TaxID=2964700 RepID=UPI00286E7398|nr:hypothetical protein [Chamaesiphon sp. VAR_48_metabat_403]
MNFGPTGGDDFKPMPRKERAKLINLGSIRRVFVRQYEYYKTHAKFSENINNLNDASELLDLFEKGYQTETQADTNSAITAAIDPSSENNNTFGVIKILKSKYISKKVGFQYAEGLYFLCSSGKGGTLLPSKMQFANMVSSITSLKNNNCPNGYVQIAGSIFREHLAGNNIMVLLNRQINVYGEQQKFIKETTLPPSFIQIEPEIYSYQIQVTPKQAIVSARPKSNQDPSNWTYLAIAKEDINQKSSFIQLYCESPIANIAIPNIADTTKFSKDCPTGYKKYDRYNTF